MSPETWETLLRHIPEREKNKNENKKKNLTPSSSRYQLPVAAQPQLGLGLYEPLHPCWNSARQPQPL